MPIHLSPPLIVGTGSQPLLVGCSPSGEGSRTALLSLQTSDPVKPGVSFAPHCEGLVPAFADGFERDPADL